MLLQSRLLSSQRILTPAKAFSGSDTAGPNWRNPAAVIKREQSLQSNRLNSDVRERVEAAVEGLGYRVTAGDVAARAGVKVAEADEALQALTFDTEGALEVSAEGDVVYALSPSFRQTLRNRSVVLAARPLLQKLQAFGGWLVRAAFGTALVSSIFIVWLAITVILSSNRDRDRDRGGGYGAMGGYRGVNVFFNLTDLFYYFDPRLSPQARYERQSGEQMSLVAAIFSFVFGDGDPNATFEERRWKALGTLIQARDGVVTAEEMAPFLDPPEPTMAAERGIGAASTSAYEDESFVLPALLRFGGEPIVDESTGGLLYKFPSLQRTTRGQSDKGWEYRREASLVQEEEWKLTKAEGLQVAIAAGLGGFNVLGVGVLSSMLTDPGSRYVLFAQGLGWIANAMPALQLYAFAFFAIPALRWLINQRRNAAIEDRNEARAMAARLVNAFRSDKQLSAKLAAARREGQRLTLAEGDMIFSSGKEASAQVNDLEASEFDRKLGISRDTRQSSNGRTTAPQRTPVSVEEDRWGEL
eukprot:CAMPEP_0202338920 /NCGR_PEP_ID=MMETSP1126-20121109/1004_1 /ASSEMBLY_ACC=CAM_ASM_000457 /TAXON_ID=3047 /ORGANISM="Dunaliella tertiolecta, Strain CCMP1320" /LENGTH=527 /DNA_ID=CAMNT_0048929397 /DNA_START=20 /DNA_END=1603 /DNA_ORIENTATION=-